eukprot:jgi/Orpsp1_1/1183669/evm.model.c7180000086231.1
MDKENVIYKIIKNFCEIKEKVNILVAGKVGVGKNTLINSLFKEEIDKTNVQKYSTKYMKEINKNNIHFSIFNLESTELQNFEKLKISIKNSKSQDETKHIHCAWVCIAEESSRFEKEEKDLIKLLLSLHIPVIVVLTKSISNNRLDSKIKNDFPKINEIIRVNAKEIRLEDGHKVGIKNLNKLIESTNNNISNKNELFIASQKISIEIKVNTANSVVNNILTKITKNDFLKYIIIYEKLVYIVIYISWIFNINLEIEFIKKMNDLLFNNLLLNISNNKIKKNNIDNEKQKIFNNCVLYINTLKLLYKEIINNNNINNRIQIENYIFQELNAKIKDKSPLNIYNNNNNNNNNDDDNNIYNFDERNNEILLSENNIKEYEMMDISENSLSDNYIKKINEIYGKVNILVAGKTGVGKSTLINAIFKEEITETGVGIPITNNINEITKDNVPFSIFDSKGIVLQNYEKVSEELKNFILNREKSKDENKRIHLAWVCIAEGSSRIEEAERDLIKLLLSLHIPIIIVLTKSMSLNNEFQNEVKRICPKVNEIIRVNAKEIRLEDGYKIKIKNLDKLIEVTSNNLSNNKKISFIASQKISIEIKENISKKEIINNLNEINKKEFYDKNLLNEKLINILAFISWMY